MGTIVVVMVHPQKGQTAMTCKAMAEAGGGAYSYDAFGTACWAVYGKAVMINPVLHSIKQGFQITNMNFHTNGDMASTQSDTVGSNSWQAEIGATTA